MSNEQTFTTDLKASFIKHGAFFFKIPDMPHGAGGMTSFDIKKPFDAVALYRGRAIAIEAKFLKEYKSFGLKDLRPNQIDGLNWWEMQGGESYVMLNVRRPNNPLTGSKRCNRLMIFPWKEFKNREKNYFKDELVKRIQWDYCKGEYPVIEYFLKDPGRKVM